MDDLDAEIDAAEARLAAARELRGADAIAAYEPLMAELGDSPDFAHVTGAARLGRANALLELGRPEDAVEAYAELLRLHGRDDQALPRTLTATLQNQAQVLEDLGRRAEAAAAWGSLIERFEGSAEPWVRASVAAAMACRGDDLEQLGRTGDAVALYRRLVATFPAGEDAEIDRPRGWAERRLATLRFRRRERIARRLMFVAAIVLAVLASRPPRA